MEGAFVMKYMTFNASCAYAGLANILERFGIETEDREIALAMGLPYLFAKEGEYTVKVLPLARGNRAVKMSSPAHFARQLCAKPHVQRRHALRFVCIFKLDSAVFLSAEQTKRR